MMFKTVSINQTVIISKNSSQFQDNNIITDFEFYSYHNRSTPGVFFIFECKPDQEYILNCDITSTNKDAMLIISQKKCKNQVIRIDTSNGKINENISFNSHNNKELYLYVLLSGGKKVFNKKVYIKEIKIVPKENPNLILKQLVVKPELKPIDNKHFNCIVDTCELETESYSFLNFNTSKKAELTVALPIFRGKDSVWLAFEGLIRQKNVTFPWELVIAEEDPTINSGCFGIDNIIPYFKRLRDTGCVSIKYIPLDCWIPLSKKWCLLGKMAEDTICFVIHDDHSYSGDTRLYETYNEYKKSDCLGTVHTQGLFLSITDGYIGEYQKITVHGLFASYKTDSIKYGKISTPHYPRLVDGWLNGFTHIRNRHHLLSSNTSIGLIVDGWNTLSRGRDNKIKHGNSLIKPCSIDLNKYFPLEIVQRLNTYKGIKYDNYLFNCKHKFSGVLL
jgi:hypothetical protein